MLFNKYIQTAVGGLVVEKKYGSSFLEAAPIFSIFVFIGFGGTYFVLRYQLILETYIFDKNASTLTIKNRGLWVNEVAERSLDEISKIALEKVHVQKTEDHEAHILYKVCLLMNGGDTLSLGESNNQKEQQKIADWIRSYIEGQSPSDAI